MRLAPFLLVAAAFCQQPVTFDQLSRQASQARERNQLDKAAALYREALKLRPKWNEGWWFLGTLLYDRDQYVEARDAFYQLAALDPKNGKAFAMLGLCEFRTKEYEPALVHLNRARILGLGDAPPQMVQVAMYHTRILLAPIQEF